MEPLAAGRTAAANDQTYVRATVVTRAISASRCRTICRLASGAPNVSRSRHQRMVRSTQRWAMAQAWIAIETRSLAKWRMICRKPVPSAPTRWSAGTRTSMKDSSAVSEQCQPSLRSGGLTCTPGVALVDDEQGDALVPGSGRYARRR